MPLPSKIANAPELMDGLGFYLKAFYDLETERAVGFGLGAIPRTAIRNYATELELTNDEYSDLIYHINAMDVAYLKYINSKNK